jgi:Predicted integral membrane protein (DUF2269)
MTLFALIVFIHLTGAVALFLAFGLEWAAISFLGNSNTPQEAQAWLRLGRLGPLINGPALGVLILSGGYLAHLNGSMKQGWIPASLVGILVVGAFGGAINVPRMRAIRLAIPESGEKLSSALHNKLLPISVRLRTFSALSIVFMMVAKLPFAQSMLALLGGLILGLLFSIPVATRKPA